MCGLVGLFAREPSSRLAAVATAMSAAVAHRGPDDDGLATFAGLRPVARGAPASIALGHRRLAIQDLSAAARQPMADPSRRFWLIYNGEVYNHRELRVELEREGVCFRSSGDTEVLLHWLGRRGRAGLDALDGMFALLLIDLREGRLMVVRDRFGIKPLYTWMAPDGTLVFASESKQLTHHQGFSARLEGQRGWDYLSRGLIDHTEQTLFRDVHQVPAGAVAEIDLRSPPAAPRFERWYRLSRRAGGELGDPASWASGCRELLARSVERRMRADVTVGSCLSGGLDSSAIVSLVGRGLAADHPGQLTFTARSPQAALDEWPHARAVAAAVGARPVEVWADGGRLFEELDELVYSQDEPFGSPSVYLQREVFRAAAASGVKVMLDGQGADEQLAGYHSFFGVRLLELVRGGRLGEATALVRALGTVHGWPRKRSVRQLLHAWLPAELAQPLTRNVPALGGGRGVIVPGPLGAEPIDPLYGLAGRRHGVRAFSRELLSRLSLPMLLHWEDRSSMAASVEARVPFLDPALVEWTLALPAPAKLDGAMTKAVLRRAMRGLIPESVRARTDKVAFAAPEERWLTRDHRDLAAGRLRDALEVLGPAISAAGRLRLAAILAGTRPYDNILWRVICFGAWARRFQVRV